MAVLQRPPMTVRAMQWDGSWDSSDAIERWSGCYAHPDRSDPGALFFERPDGTHVLRPGDWLMQDLDGRYYSCNAVDFDDIYERADT